MKLECFMIRRYESLRCNKSYSFYLESGSKSFLSFIKTEVFSQVGFHCVLFSMYHIGLIQRALQSHKVVVVPDRLNTVLEAVENILQRLDSKHSVWRKNSKIFKNSLKTWSLMKLLEKFDAFQMVVITSVKKIFNNTFGWGIVEWELSEAIPVFNQVEEELRFKRVRRQQSQDGNFYIYT